MDTTVKAPAVSGDQREYLFDNYKVLLILLVVIGHFIEPSNDQNSFLYELKWGIVAFHMPAFIFISGYFSKRIPSLKKMLCGLVIPYFVYEILYYLLYTFVLDKETGFYFARPKFSLWYLMALFAWRLFSPLVEKIPRLHDFVRHCRNSYWIHGFWEFSFDSAYSVFLPVLSCREKI